jgi:peptidoglycan/LPS O-acetylase OafA/YrhL
MCTARRNRRLRRHVIMHGMIRTSLAVLAGLLASAVFAVAADGLAARLFPAHFIPAGEVHGAGMLAAMLVYTLLGCALGGWVAGAIARARAQLAALVLAGMIVVFTIVNLIRMSGGLPWWWSILVVLLTTPAVLLGASLHAARRSP